MPSKPTHQFNIQNLESNITIWQTLQVQYSFIESIKLSSILSNELQNSPNKVHHNQVQNDLGKYVVGKGTLRSHFELFLVLRVDLDSETHSQDERCHSRNEPCQE